MSDSEDPRHVARIAPGRNRKERRVLEANSRHVLTAEDARLFQAALDTPPAPTPRALKAAESYRRRVLRAD